MKRLLAIFLLCASNAFAFSDADAVKVILIKAGDDSYREMYAVACSLRNRTDLENVWEARMEIPGQPSDRQEKAEKAWADSLSGPDITNGANVSYRHENHGNYIRQDSPIRHDIIPVGETSLYHVKWKKKDHRATIGLHEFYHHKPYVLENK